MADNTTLNSGSGGDSIRTEDRTTFKTPVSLIDVGGTSAEALIGDAGVSMPINDGGNTITVDGTVAVTGTFWQATQPVSLASVPSHAVTNAGTFAVQVDGAALTSLQLIDDAVSGAGFNVTQLGGVNVAMGTGTRSSGTQRVTIATDDVVPASQSGTWNITNVSGTVSLPTGAATAAKQPALGTAGTASSDVITVQGIASMTALKVDGSAVTQPVSGTFWQATQPVSLASVPSHAVTNAGTFVVQVDGTALTRLTDIETNTDSGAVVGNGAAATAQRVTLASDSTGIVALTTSTASIGKLASNTGVTIGAVEIAAAQTLATVTTVSTVTTCSTVTTLTGGGVASDGVDSGNPIKTGARAVATLSTATLVSAADRVDTVADVDGATISRSDAALADLVNGNATNTDGTSTQCIAAGGSGVKTYLTDCTIANSSASNITVDIKDGTTVKWTFPVPAGGGVTHSWQKPLPGTANTAWNFDPSAAATTVTCSMSGFKSKV